MPSKPRTGFKSPKYGHLGVYFLSTGPDQCGPRPGNRLQVVIYHGDCIVRRFEQVEGACLEPGYVDFFGGPNNHPGRYVMPIVDIAPDGTRTVLVPDFQPESPRSVLSQALCMWVGKYGCADSLGSK